MSLSEEQNHMQAQRNETERSLTEYPRRLPAGGQRQTHIVTSQMPFQLLLSLKIVRMPKVTPHSHCTCPWFHRPPNLDCSVCFLSLSNLSGLNSLPIPLQHMIPAHDGWDNCLLKKTQKTDRLEPLIIVGLQLQLDNKLHLLMIGNFHSIWQDPHCPLTTSLFIV